MGKKPKKQFNPKRRFITGISAGLLLMAMFAMFFVPVKKAQALFPGDALLAAIWKESRDAIRYIGEKAGEAAEKAYKIAKDVAFKNALRIYLTRIAEDTATAIATAGSGQTPLFIQNPGEYFVDIGDAALGDALDNLSQEYLGVSLCDIGPVKVKLDLALRAEINPNFCTDGCQDSYETKLINDQSIKEAAQYLQSQYDVYYRENVNLINSLCREYQQDMTQCEPDPYCTVSGSNCVRDESVPIDRRMTDEELHGGVSSSAGIPFDRENDLTQAIGTYCTSYTITNLNECITSLNYAWQQLSDQYEFERQRCVRLCTGARTTAKCSFTQIRDRVDTAWVDSREYYRTIIDGFKSGNNEVSQYLQVYVAAREQSEIEKQKEKDALTFSGIGPLRSLITGSIITPSTLTEAAAEKPVAESGQDVTTYTGSPIADAIGVFQDTLTKKLIERIFNREQGGFTNQKTPSLFGGGYNSGGIAAARAQFAKAFTPNVTRESNKNYDTLAELQNDDVIDGDFAEAVRQELTIEEAVEKNLLHGEWYFGYNQNRQEPATGNGGYPASSFSILRSHRIIPVGWEIAAQYNKQYDDGSVSLSTLLEKFEDDSSPYFGLVDPKWVLKAPLAICAKQGYGGELIDETCQSSQIVAVVNDTDPNCLAGEHDTNNDGQCDEEDPPIFENTCEREQVCVDNQTCIKPSADGKGCEEYGYCTKELPIWRFAGEACNSEFESCQAYTTVDNELVSYLIDTTDSTSCNANNVGCQRYCYRDATSGEFECYNTTTESFQDPQIYFDNDAEACGEGDEGCTTFNRTVAGANVAPNSTFNQFAQSFPVPQQAEFDGWSVGGEGQTCGAQSFLDTLASGGTYAMRVQRLTNACPGDAAHSATLTIDLGQDFVRNRDYTVSFNARAQNAPCTGDVTISNAFATQTFTPEYTSEFRRYSDTISFPDAAATGVFFVTIEAPSACTITLDDVKVERGGTATAHSQYGDDAITMKAPPAHLNCTGSSGDDPECANYAVRCDAQNVGCSAFTPAAGGLTIPAQISDVSQCDSSDPTQCDQCPAAFVGCKAFHEEALTAKVPLATHAERLSSGLVSIVPNSGRSCSAQYVGCEEYTNLDKVGQGGEALEYYSKVRQCVDENDPDAAYYFSWVGSESNGFELKRWNLKETQTGSGAPCTNLAVSADPNAVCEDGVGGNVVNDCQADFGSDPRCVEFFDDGGTAHYRYIDEVIFATAACSGFRNTIDGNTYYFDPSESTTCPARFAGCREYKGAAANNTRNVINDNFENTASPLADWQNASLSAETLTFPGHSMEVVNAFVHKGVELTDGKSYVIEFWARAAGAGDSLRVYFDNVGSQSTPQDQYFTWNGTNANLPIGTEWQLYRLGPVVLDGTTPPHLIFNASTEVYVDNITLKETTQNIFVVKGTAASCDGYENCQRYRDQNGTTHTLKSFSRLCQSSFVGCEALINTFNSDSVEAQVLPVGMSYQNRYDGTSSNQVPGDQVQFYVNDRDAYCAADAASCQEFGFPIVKQDGTVEEWDSVYLLNDPDGYDTSLCSESGVGCQQYAEVEDGSLSFFKDPGQQVCEYRTAVGPSNLNGWFKKGTNELCNEPWTRSCPADQSTCREYFSPRIYNNPAAPDEQSYYYLASSVSSTECPQGIDPNDSCIGFEDQQAGANTLRAKLDADDPDTVVSQSCQVCSTNANTCGRNGNAPCCAWDASICSTDSAAGGDSAAPHYCVWSSPEEDFEQCQISLTGSFAVPNAGDPTNATNCGQPGQPQCFDMNNATPTTDDDYLAARRYCGDYACTVNTVLKVTADRICSEWLECTNEQTVIRDGRETTVCLERTLITRDGNYIESPKENLVKSSPSGVKDLANYSGLTKAGMLTAGNELIDGLFPYDAFTEEGLAGALIELPDSNFETHKISSQESPVQITSASPGTTWLDADGFDWKATENAEGDTTAQLRLEKTDTPDNFSNQYLSIVSQSTSENGAFVDADLSGEITEDAEYYMLSFRAKKTGTLAAGIRMSLYQDGVGDVFLDANAGGVELSTSWQQFVVQLNNNPGLTIDPAGATIDLRFLHRNGNVPGESMQIDDIQLKPVLHVQDSISGTPEPGLYGYYFQSEMRPAPGATSGLVGSYYNGLRDFSNPDWGAPTTTRTDAVVDFSPAGTPGNPPAIGGAFTSSTSAEWNGGIRITDSTETTFYFNQNDRAQLFIEDLNSPIINKTVDNPSLGYSGKLSGVPEGWHPVRIRFVNSVGQGGLQFGWHSGLGGANFGTSTDGIHYDWNAVVGGVIQWDQIQQALTAHNSEFGQCGLWGVSGYWQSCIGGSDPNRSCTSNADCPGGGTCESFKLCNAPGQPGSIVPTANMTTELEINRDNAFSYLINAGVDSTVDFSNFNDRLTDMAKRGDAVGVRWVGEVQANAAGSYQFHVTHKDGVRLWIGDTLVIDQWNDVGGASTQSSGTISLEAGWHALKLEYYKNVDVNQDAAVVRLGWTVPGGSVVYPIPEGNLRNYPPAPTGFVQRECRSYPQSDSLICDYTDPQSGVVYKGWKGYCVEKDPRDPNVCLNWWPIDVLAGETNIFSDQEQSLTRAPLYYCAETEKKPEPFRVAPNGRVVCVRPSGDPDSHQCQVLAKVSNLKPAGYDLTPSDWQYGVYDTNNNWLGARLIACGSDVDEGSDCLNNSLFSAVGPSSNDWETNATELRQYYANVTVRPWVDENEDINGCEHDEPSNNSPDGGAYSCDGDDAPFTTRPYNHSEGANWDDDEVFPVQCTTVVQTTKKNGTSTPWTNKVQNGVYTTHPTKYSLGTACAPFGALPVIETPQDVINCVPDPTNPPQYGCSTDSGSCEEVDDDGNPNTDPPGECLLAPLEIYHPDNPDNGNISSICSETRLGAGFYSCGTTGICQTCIGGDRNGLMCLTAADCPNAPEQDFNGDGIPDSACQQTFGVPETTGDADHLFAIPGQVVPSDPPLTTIKSGIARLKQLFARSYGFWEWSDTAQKYIRKKDSFGRDYPNWSPPIDDGRNILNEATNVVINYGTASNPVAGGVCNNSDYHTQRPNLYCGIRPTVSGIQVSGGYTQNSDLVLSGENRIVSLEFDYEIDPEQRPLKSITIDWGDTAPLSVYKSASAQKTFRCDEGSNGCTACPGGVVPQGYDHDNDNTTADIQACIYDGFPRIQVRDNWDWCNVRSGSTAFSCQTSSTEWDQFSGRIVVLP